MEVRAGNSVSSVRGSAWGSCTPGPETGTGSFPALAALLRERELQVGSHEHPTNQEQKHVIMGRCVGCDLHARERKRVTA